MNGELLFSGTRRPWVPPGASLYFDFMAGQGYSGSFVGAGELLTTTRASDAYAPNAAGVYSLFSSNVPRITDLGLLVEEARTNSIRNNSMQGAVAGTPGTPPTNWTPAAPGLTIQLVGTGTENGVDYIDYRFSGTTGATFGQITWETSTAIAAVNGQTWAGSAFLKLVSGSLTNVNGISVTMSQRDVGGAAISSVTLISSIHSTLSATLARFSGSGATNSASTAFVLPLIGFTWSNGVAVDFTLRIGWPQLELGAFATSPIRTTSAAATRAADLVTVTSPPTFGSAYTLFAQAVPLAPSAYGTSQNVLETSDGTTSQRALMRRSATTGGRLFTVVGGTSGAVLNSGTEWAPNTRTKMAMALAAGDQAAVFDGGSVTTTTKATLPTTPTAIRLANNSSGTEQFNGWLERAAVFATARLTNAQLQALTA